MLKFAETTMYVGLTIIAWIFAATLMAFHTACFVLPIVALYLWL